MSAPDVTEIEERLAAARALVARAAAAVRAKPVRDTWADYKGKVQTQLRAERELALARGEPACMPLEWQPRWSIGAPCPHVVAGSKTYLVYMVDEVDPTWDGTTARRVDPSSNEHELLAVVEFLRCYAHRFGGPNDEVWRGHPLHGKGLDLYGAHLVANSAWIAAERTTNQVHSQFRPERWANLRHYLLLFHDQMFECLAEAHAIEETLGTFRDVLGQLVDRVAGRG